MTVVAVLGAGGGGQSAAVELSQAGHRVRLWNRREETLAAIRQQGCVRFRGVLGEGSVRPDLVTTDLDEALDGADVAVVCLPSIAHEAVFADLASRLGDRPLVLNPGHTGGALHARECWRRAGCPLPPIAELSTLTYVARVHDDVVTTTGRATLVRGAALPGGRAALDAAVELFPGVEPASNVLVSSLSNVNLVLHPPGALLGLSWVEATRGDFTFYVDGMTPAVARVMAALDGERVAVARAFGLEVAGLVEEMRRIGTVEPEDARTGSLAEAVRGGRANATIKAPDSTAHRYYREDFPFGLLPFLALASVAGVPVPTASALLELASAAVGPGLLEHGLDAAALGVAGLDADALVRSVSG